MNALIEHLNQLGGQFLNFAVPMLWQSSLLIVLVLTVDFSLARKIRASVRHALWLAVLVKLLLPPTLALPTGAAWWLFPAKPAVKAPAPRDYVVTYDNAMPLPAFTQGTVPFVEPPPPKLDRAGWTLVGTGVVSAGLMLWLLFRWAQAVRMVHRATQAGEFSGPVREAQRLAGLGGLVRVKIAEDRRSPAVCGLCRPVILLPRMLAETLSADQLRAVLLHEAIHIRRKDIWVNCAQALLQVAYWWHPLVWVANARIRRAREEAVDEAVMLALDADAEIYAPTLLEVARLAFRRPLMSLGLVGIMESRSALRQRIERLLAFRAPRKAGMTLASLCGICIFSAVALPMGEGPAPVEKEMAADASPPLRGMSEVSMAATTLATVPRTNPPSVLVTAEIYEMSGENCKNLLSTMPINPGNQGKANESAWWPVAKDEFSKLLNDLKHSGLAPVQRPRVLTSSGKAADFFVGHDTHGTELDCLPVVNGGQVDLAVQFETMDLSARVPVMNRFKVNALMENQSGVVIRVPNDLSNSVVFLNVEILTNRPSVSFQPRLPPVAQPRPADAAFNPPVYTGFNPPVYTGPGRQAIMAKLGKIRLGNVFYDSLPLNEVLKQLSHECKLLDPEGKGINFLINNHPDHSSQPGAAGTTAGGGVAANEAADPGSVIVKIPSLTDVRLADVLDAIVLVADHPIKYSVQDFAVVFSAKNSATPPLSTRTFRADPNTFYSGLESVSAQSFGAIQNSGSAGGGGGQNQNNGAVVGAVNAFGGTSGGGQGSESLLNNPGANLAGDGGSAQAASAAASARQTAVTFRLNYPKPEAELKTLLSEAGVKMPPATLVCNAKAGLFLVRGTPDQLVLANRLVLKLNGYTPQEIQSYDGGFAKSMNKVPVVADESTNLFMRTFRVDPNTFYSGLINASGPGFQNAQTNGGVKLPYVTTQTSTSTPSALARACFSSLGVNLTNPPGKSVFFSDRTGELFVKATKSDLDTIERALAVLNQIPPQIHIKARFYEVPSGTLKDFGKYLNAINPIDGKPMGILTFQNANAARQALQSRKSVKVLAEPEITMLSGRQAQMRATEMVTVVTNTLFESLRTNQFGELEHNVVTPQTEVVETGPILDIVPHVLADNYTIHLAAMPSVMEFLGYEGPTNSSGTPYYFEGKLPQISPRFRTQQSTAVADLWDTQTLFLGGLPRRVADSTNGFPQVMQDKEVMVFITATIVDSAGSRVHSEDEMPFAQDEVPSQPQGAINLPPSLLHAPNLPPSSANGIRFEPQRIIMGTPVGDFPPYHNGDPRSP